MRVAEARERGGGRQGIGPIVSTTDHFEYFQVREKVSNAPHCIKPGQSSTSAQSQSRDLISSVVCMGILHETGTFSVG